MGVTASVVTGGGRGIGLATARRLGTDGHRVVIADLDGAGAKAAAQGLRDEGLDCTAEALDVTQPGDCERLAERLAESHGGIRALVNCANIAVYGQSEHMSIPEWRRQLDVGLSGLFYVTQAVARRMIAAGSGSIVNIASVGGMGGWPMRAAYNASKAGVINLTEVLAAEWGHAGVRVNAVSPGVVRTEMMTDAIEQGVASEARYVGRIPMGRLARPDEIASVIAFLVSDRSSGITGVNVRIDGGWVAWANPAGMGFPE
jgi:NAD(P)-dependent dehydrogenase (short-subunit alcohol dehydrogenase family)